MTPQFFLATVSGIIRLGKLGWQKHQEALLRTDYTTLLPPRFPTTPAELETRMFDWVRLERPDLLTPGSALAGLLVRQDGELVPPQNDPKQPERLERARLLYASAYQQQHGASKDAARDESGALISPTLVLVHREWISAGVARARWARVGLEIASISLDIINTQPDKLGMGKRATAIVGGLAPHLKELIEEDLVEGDQKTSFGERLVRTFMRSTLETVAERHELFVSEERWRPIVAGLVVPINQHLKEAPANEIFALDRLERLMRGPVAHSILTSISSNPDAFLTRRFGGDKALGAVARSVLGALVATEQDEFDLMEVLSGEGAGMVYTAALEIATTRPELFIDGKGNAHEAQRSFLKKLGASLKNAPSPFDWRGSLAPQLAVAALEVAGEYASARIRQNADDTAWGTAGVEVAEHVIGSITQGFAEALKGKSKSPFERLFQREQAVEILRMVALRVATTPGMIAGDRASPEVKNIASGLATVFAENASGLLNGDDWKLVAATAIDLAAKNPGTLFGLKDNQTPERQVIVLLLRGLLSEAAHNVREGRTPGAILFGDTLREAMLATVQAAASRLVTLADDEAGDGLGMLERHVQSLQAFIRELLKVAGSDEASLRMSAAEWLHVYRTFVVHVLEHGPAAFDPDVFAAVALNEEASTSGSPDKNGRPLWITRNAIVAALRSQPAQTDEGSTA